NHDDVDDAVNLLGPFVVIEDVSEVNLAVVAVRQDRGKGEEHNAGSKDEGKAVGDSRESVGSQSNAVRAFVEMFTSNDDGYSGERTYNDGVQKRLPCSNQAFFSWTTVLGHVVCQSRGTNTSDVRKQCALNTDDGHTQNSAGNTFWGECSLEDLHEGIRNLREVKA